VSAAPFGFAWLSFCSLGGRGSSAVRRLAEFAGLGRWGLQYCPASILLMAGEGVQNFSPGEKEPEGPDGDLSGLTGEQLMDRVAGHDDEEACTLLVQRSTGSIMARCYALTRNTATAQEITQETFMRIWRFRKTWTQRDP